MLHLWDEMFFATTEWTFGMFERACATIMNWAARVSEWSTRR
jgi:hypothetical protein